MEKRCKLKKGWKILISFACFFFLLFLGVIIYYHVNLGSVSNSKSQKEVEIEKGSGSNTIAKVLKSNNLIRNEYVFLIYLKLNHISDLKYGTYLFREDMDVKAIISELKKGSTYNPDAITITFQEGLNMREIAKIIEANTVNSYQDVLEKASDIEYISRLKEKYWFITDEIDANGIYYKLEGYLFPDTYEFKNKEVSVEYIFDKMISELAKKLESYNDFDYTTLSIHERLTLASMVEKESPVKSDRKKMAAVFLNRKRIGMNLGSDVTARYANKIDDKSKALTSLQFDLKNPYNTRCQDGSMNGRLPIGPIANVSVSSIEAAFAPDEHEYLYFISNIKTLETFFYEKYSDFLKKKDELREVNQGF